MDRVTSAMIDVVESAYDMQPQADRWFLELLDVSGRIFESAVGAIIRIVERPVDGGPIRLGEQYATSTVPSDWNETTRAMFKSLPPELIDLRTRPGTAHTYSELFGIYRELREQFGVSGTYAEWSVDSNIEVIRKSSKCAGTHSSSRQRTRTVAASFSPLYSHNRRPFPSVSVNGGGCWALTSRPDFACGRD